MCTLTVGTGVGVGVRGVRAEGELTVGTVETEEVDGGDEELVGPGALVGGVTMRAPEASPPVGVACEGDDCADCAEAGAAGADETSPPAVAALTAEGTASRGSAGAAP